MTAAPRGRARTRGLRLRRSYASASPRTCRTTALLYAYWAAGLVGAGQYVVVTSGPGVRADADLIGMARDEAFELRRAVSVEMFEGPSQEVYRKGLESLETEPLATFSDVEVVRALVDSFSSFDLTPRVVVPALAGVVLVFVDEDGASLGAFGLLSARWVRGVASPYDGLLAAPIPHKIMDRLGLADRLRGSVRALDDVEPSMAAVTHPDSPTVEHALAPSRTETLCGIAAADVTVYRHLFRYHATDCRTCSTRIWTTTADRRSRPTALEIPQAQRLTTAWKHAWPQARPVPYELRSDERWVRFHSLPGSQRYAHTDADHEEILRRHRTVLNDLVAADPRDRQVVAVTSSWSGGPDPYPLPAPVAEALPASRYWQSILTDDSEPDFPRWMHLYSDEIGLDDPRLDQLLLLAADSWTSQLIIADADFRWIYAPYDGGADVYPATVQQRDHLRHAHASWLSPRRSRM